MISVREILELALPEGTQVVAGERALGREVSWATRPKPSPPAFAHLKGGELVLLSGTALSNVDERMALETAVKELASLKVSAIAFVGTVSDAAKSAADEHGVVFLKLPPDVDLGSLERETSHLITEHRRDAQRSGQESGRRLMELAISGESVHVLVATLAEIAGATVVLEGRDGRIISFATMVEGVIRAEIEPILSDGREALFGWLRMMAASSPAEPPSSISRLSGDWTRVVAPVIGRDGLFGSISVLVRGRRPTQEEESLTSRGAAACAIVMVRDYATLVARREIEVNVLDEVLDGALRSEVTLLQQAKRLGHDLLGPHMVIVARLDSINHTSIVRSRDNHWSMLDDVLTRRGPRLLWRVRQNGAEILWPAGDPNETNVIAAQLHEEFSRKLTEPATVVSVGSGRVQSGLAGIQQSHQEAKQALTMGRRLSGVGGITRFEDLGVYRLIFASEHLTELHAFHDEALKSLIEYDKGHGGELVRTLKAFFDAKCGPKEAAGLLDVHRNTVLYRLERIKEITGLDLDSADVRLRLHLALCIHSALFNKED